MLDEPPLFRKLEKRFIKNLFDTGTFSVSPLYRYHDIELLPPPIGDRSEGRMPLITRGLTSGDVHLPGFIRYEDSQGVIIDHNILRREYPNCFVSCFTMTEDHHSEAGFSTDIGTIKLIVDVQTFSQCVAIGLMKKGFSISGGFWKPVTYMQKYEIISDSNPTPQTQCDPFQKPDHPAYKAQNEYRFVWTTSKRLETKEIVIIEQPLLIGCFEQVN